VLFSLLFLAKVQLDAALATAIASPFYLAKLICDYTPGLCSGWLWNWCSFSYKSECD